jgi:hypothetical protein
VPTGVGWVRVYRSLPGLGCAIIRGSMPGRSSQRLDDVFDEAVIFRGFADYMRDYEVFIYATADPRTGVSPDHLRYRLAGIGYQRLR